ncbi:MAG: hypothetical protein C4526_12900 [Nitrospiraceae bacterium]|nr:MAG: hypothetical protein C4526_12900 [Nitrospiraceae bacterium]
MNMSLLCKGCGRPVNERIKKCICGYDNEGWNLMVPGNNGSEEAGAIESESTAAANNGSAGEPVIKEIDSWQVSFSLPDNCICFATPALKPFSLRLTIGDLEELLEFAYQMTGTEKTTRKLRLSAQEITDLVDRVQRLTRDKISKAAIEFADDELNEIAGLLNVKLKS